MKNKINKDVIEDSTEITENDGNNESVEITENAESTEGVKNTENAENTEGVKNIENAESMEGVEKSENKLDLPDLSQLENELKKENYKLRYKSVLKSTFFTLVVVAAVAVLVAVLWMPVLKIYGTSMTPTLSEGQIVISVKGTQPKQGDIVGVYYGSKLLIKRCIAGSGDWVNIDRNGNVFVNGKYIDEPYIQEKSRGECDIQLPYQVPENSIFVMGDHRETSIDSRSSSVGCIDNEDIIGKIVFRVWPLKLFGIVD